MQSYDHPTRPVHRYTVATTSMHPTPTRPRHSSLAPPPRPYGAPPIPSSPLPPSLTPGAPRPGRGIISPQLVTSPFSSPISPPTSISGRMSLYGDYFTPPTAQPPPVPSKPFMAPYAPPPLPSRPAIPFPSPAVSRNPLYPHSIPVRAPSSSSYVSPREPRKFPTTNEQDLTKALALTADAKRREEELLAQEEEEFAKALEESRLYSGSLDRYSSLEKISQEGPSASSKAVPPPSPLEGESWLQMNTPSTSQHSESSSINFPSPLTNGRELSPSTSNDAREVQVATAASASLHSLYSNAVSNLVTRPTSSHSSIPSPSVTSTPPYPSISPSNSLAHKPSIMSTSTESTADCSSPPPPRLRGNTASISHIPSIKSSHSISTSSSTVAVKPLKGKRPSSNDSKSSAMPSSPNPSVESSKSSNGLDEEDSGTRTIVPFSAIQYVEPELLLGVSLGYNRPMISVSLTPMMGQMPNIITLPYAKAPVFFFQAPSWRRLLKLMARLSATRIEPTREASTVAKHELRLRTVIQFVRVHHSSSEWRTILYFTIDMPVPSSVQNAHKYTSGDVTVLPFSYTLFPLPTLLRDGPESQMTKYYVIPSTSTTPSPKLSIDFPDLAMYLQSAVDDSRRAANDSSSGLRKLASFIDSCYPNDAGAAPIDRDPPRRGVGGMLMRVIGKAKGGARGRGNEEIYDLVTPFFANEWC